MATISSIHAHEILDSRGYPTVEATLTLDNGIEATSSVPSGASTGSHEAVELRDNDKKRYLGKGVLTAVNHVNTEIARTLRGVDVTEMEKIDQMMKDLDGTPNKAKLGANAILAVSESALKAAASAYNQPLYSYIFEKYHLINSYQMPQPTLNVINGGKHGNGKLEFQEFHILPRRSQPFTEMMRMGVEVYLYLQKLLKDNGIFQGVGDEGGFTGNFKNNVEALEYLEKSVTAAGYQFKADVRIGLDTASSEFYSDGKYHIADFNHPLTSDELIAYYKKLNDVFDFGYLEDGLYEDDYEGWHKLTHTFTNTDTPIVGDDFLTTNPDRVRDAIKYHNCNAVLVKPNQIGTVTEFMEVVRLAKEADWKVVLSHRSGETTDTFISDVAVGVGADIVKFGAPARGERVGKYNRLMDIEREIIAR